jgi:outer membrane protein assembly factor BamB
MGTKIAKSAIFEGVRTMSKYAFRRIWIGAILGFALILCAAAPLLAQLDGEQPAFRVDQGRTGRSSYVGADDSTILWHVDLGNIVQSSPAIGSDGTIYAGSYDKSLYAVNRNGTIKWSYKTGGWISSSPATGKDGTIYVGSVDSYLYAVNPNGSLKYRIWTGQPPGADTAVNTAPNISDNNVLVFTSDRGAVYAADASTGAQLWKVNTPPQSQSSPAIADDGAVIVGSASGDVYNIRSDGSIAWTFKTGDAIISSPAIGDTNPVTGDYTVYVTSMDGKLYALDKNGNMKWSYATMGGLASSPAIGYDGTLYFGSYDGYVYALNPNGTRKWSFMVGEAVTSSPIVDVNNSIYFGGLNDYLYSVNSSGLLRWKADLGSHIYSSPAIDDHGTVYVGTWSGELYAVGDAVQQSGVPEPGALAQAALLVGPAALLIRRRRLGR